MIIFSVLKPNKRWAVGVLMEICILVKYSSQKQAVKIQEDGLYKTQIILGERKLIVKRIDMENRDCGANIRGHVLLFRRKANKLNQNNNQRYYRRTFFLN